jgi:glycosyltransferase involved in cell wall biosynthesis
MPVSSSRPKRILINALSARQGGGQTYVINLLKFMPEGYPAEIFVLSQDSLALPQSRNNIKRIDVSWPLANPVLRALWEKLRLPSLLRHVGADVLFCTGGVIGCHIPAGCKAVTMFRNMIPFDLKQRRRYGLGYMRLRNWILKRVLLRSMTGADLVICLSEYARVVLESQACLKQVAVIPHGISQSFRRAQSPGQSRPDWLPPGDYILYASAFDYYKAQIEVVQAFALFRQKTNDTRTLVLIGPAYREYLRKVYQEIAKLGLEKSVIVKGPIPYQEMPALYQHAVLSIFASECENCPNILLEALAAGQPLLVSNRPPMPEFAADAAIYFDPSDPADLASKLEFLLSDETARLDLAAKAKRRSLLYDWQLAANATWRALAEVCQEPAR